MKILYSAGNRPGSYQQLKRYYPILQKDHQVKFCSYKSSIKELNIDYCLDSLLNFSKPNAGISFNGNFSYLSKEIEKFKPELLISDFELYTSIIAMEQNIPIWQVSPMLLYYGLSKQLKTDLGIHKYNSHIISADRGKHQYIKNILNNSKIKIIVSHLCDIENKPDLLPGYQWCRPEFILNQIENEIVYSDGMAYNLADNFYNQKYTIINSTHQDLETAIGSSVTEYFGLGQNNSQAVEVKKMNIKINEEVKFLGEML